MKKLQSVPNYRNLEEYCANEARFLLKIIIWKVFTGHCRVCRQAMDN